MSEISSDNLHHFTNGFESLESILLNGFYPHIAEEDISFILKKNPNARAGFPIVCFCDLPNNLLKVHKEHYGHYGISLSKEWVIRNGITPVMYVSDKNTQVMNYFRKIQQFILNKQSIAFSENSNNASREVVQCILTDFLYNILCMSAFFRIYEDAKTGKRFYDEREWRYLYVDTDEQLEKQFYLSDMKNFDVEKRNRELQRKPLLFDALDIRNIFVKTETKKELLVNNICKDAKYKEHKTLFDGLIIVGSE